MSANIQDEKALTFTTTQGLQVHAASYTLSNDLLSVTLKGGTACTYSRTFGKYATKAPKHPLEDLPVTIEYIEITLEENTVQLRTEHGTFLGCTKIRLPLEPLYDQPEVLCVGEHQYREIKLEQQSHKRKRSSS